MPTLDELEQRVAAFEAELARLRSVEAVAQEAYAFLASRRRGFSLTYVRDVLQAGLQLDKPKQRRPRHPRRG